MKSTHFSVQNISFYFDPPPQLTKSTSNFAGER